MTSGFRARLRVTPGKGVSPSLVRRSAILASIEERRRLLIRSVKTRAEIRQERAGICFDYVRVTFLTAVNGRSNLADFVAFQILQLFVQ
jgi:hypothetical protein